MPSYFVMTRLDVWEYYLRRKSEAPEGLEQFLADVREVGIPEISRSDDASELKGGAFSDICRKHRIKREFTLSLIHI